MEIKNLLDGLKLFRTRPHRREECFSAREEVEAQVKAF